MHDLTHSVSRLLLPRPASTLLILVAAILCFGSTMLHAAPPVADLNVLIVGNSRDSADHSSISGSSDPFDATGVRSELESILAGAGLGSVNVELLDRSAEGHTTTMYSLAQWFHYPYPADIETTTRWPNLRGEKGTPWDYVILIGDPYTIEYMPGIYAHGVGLVGEEVAKGTAETVLLMPWPASGSASTVDHYKEVVYRAGRTGGYKVAPAGLAWQAHGSGGGSHPNANGAFISAASIYSRIWGQSASSSTYTYNDTLADQVHTTVTNNIGAVQYSGPFTFQNPYLMLADRRRDIHYSEASSSTESYIANECRGVLNRLRVQYNDSYRDSYSSSTPTGWPAEELPIAWNHGRPGRYYINPDFWQIAYGWNHQTNTHGGVANADADYAAENDTHLAQIFSSDLDFGDYLKGVSDTGRNVPFRLLWAGFHQEYPNQDRPVRDNAWHVNGYWQKSIAEFMVTLYSGRCPLDPQPATMNKTWYSQMIGYQAAWRIGACSSRAPGFKVRPSAASAVTVTPTTTETMTVQFVFPPRHDVTVQISSSDTSAGIVGTQTLVFTPTNYNVPQSITVAGVEGATASAPFTVDFATSSDDPAYHELTDSWAYTTTRTPGPYAHTDNGTTNYTTPKNFAVTTNLGASGATSGNTILAGPAYGSLAWDGADVVYTPDADYVGPDGFAYVSTNGSAVTTGYIHIDVIDGYPAGSVRVEATDSSAAEEGQATGVWTITREGGTASALSVNFTLGGNATLGADYNLNASSPVTIPAGQSSVVITLTPVDDSVFGEHTETATLNITAGSGYTPITSPGTISIADNDNNPPVVEAGPDQTVNLELLPTEPGLFYGTVAGNINLTDPNPETQVLVDPSTQTENSIAGNTTEIYTGQIYDADGNISFTEHIDDKAWISIDGVVVINDGSYNSRTSTANLNLTPGWHDIEIRISNGSGGSGPTSGIGIGFDPAGGTAWQTLTDPGDGSFLRANTNSMAAIATLNGSSVTDPEDSPIFSWTDTGTGTGTGTVIFSDANVLSPTVTISDVGTYVLRLTANDGYGDVYDEVTITVGIPNNNPPVTDAGEDQTVYMSEGGGFTAGITYHPITGDEDSGISSTKTYTHAIDFGNDTPRALINGVQFQAGGTAFGDKAGTSATVGTGTTSIPTSHGGNTGAEAYLNGGSACAMEDLVEDMQYGDSTAVITLTGLTPGVHYQFRLYHRVWGGNRSQNIGFDVDGTNTDITGAEYTASFDECDASQPAPSFGTSTQVYALTFDYSLPAGVTSLNVYINQTGDGTYHLYGLTNEEVSSTGATATLNGSVIDGEQTPTGTWSKVSGPGEVGFSDVNALDATATFTEAGTYVLQLTGDDGWETSTDTVTIIVNPPLPSIYATWIGGTFANPLSDLDPNGNGDGDRKSAMMEFAFGTDPTLSDDGSLAMNGSKHGEPTLAEGTGDVMEFYFVRRKDHGTSGSVSYTVQFSSDLSSFTDSVATPTWVADSALDATNYEVVKVPFPGGSNFGRVEVDFVP